MLLKKIKETEDFEFNKILKSGYKINEQPDIISKTKFANGTRKVIKTDYTDVIIELDIGCWNISTLHTYLNELVDGAYEYYSIIDNSYKKANFIVTVPKQTIENLIDNGYIVSDITITLEKSSDYALQSI
jgi:hypothetical protein